MTRKYPSRRDESWNPNGPTDQAQTSLSPTKTRTNLGWFIYGLIILAALSLVCFQIYRISTGQVPSAMTLEKTGDKQLTKVLKTTQPQIPTPVDNENVKKVLALQPMQPAELEGNDDRVTFRALGGEIVCTIAKDLTKEIPELVPLAVSPTGEAAKGSGVICAGIHNLNPKREDAGKCQQGTARYSVLGIWGEQHGLGACTNNETTPLYRDASEHRENNVDGKRFALQPLGFNQYTQVDKYACGFLDSQLRCVDITSGKGFNFTDNVGYSFF